MKKINLEDLKEKELYLDDEGKIIVKEKIKNSGKFIPNYGEIYYYLNVNGTVECGRRVNRIFDYRIFNTDYAFRTREEAEEYSKYLSALKEYRYNFPIYELKDPDVKKYYIEYRIDEDKVFYDSYHYLISNKISFRTKQDCEKFIEEAGKENIKKFMFDIWD